jgi:2-iminobutanoate/2-iminopropanoate deaminase
MAAHDFTQRNLAQCWAAAGSGLAVAWTALQGWATAAPQGASPPGIKRLSAEGEPSTAPVSAAVVHNGMIYAAAGANDSGKTDSLDITEHVTRTMDTLKKVIEAAGGDMGSIKIHTVHLASLEYYGAMNRAYNPVFAGVRAPARCTIAVGQIANNSLFLVSCIAAVVRA